MTDVVINIPKFLIEVTPGFIGIQIRRFVYKFLFKNFGRSSSIDILVDFVSPKNITIGTHFNIMKFSSLFANNGGTIKIGNNVSINTNTTISAGNYGEVEIEDDVLIAQNCVIRASNHNFEKINLNINKQGHKSGKIKIEKNVWIGANCVILKDVVIGTGSIVAAGSVVTKSVDKYTIVAGVPAKLLHVR